MAYIRKQIILELAARLEQIQKPNGFDTDAGDRIFHGPVIIGPDDPTLAIAIVPGTTDTEATADQPGSPKRIVLPVEFHALARDDLEDPLLVVESLIGDIKRAVELADHTLGGLAMDLEAGEVEPLPRVEGSGIVGTRLEYRVTYIEPWGDPEVEED